MTFRIERPKPKEEPIEPKTIGQHAKEAVRIPSQLGSSAVSAALGAPGDVLSLLNTLAAAPITKHVLGKQPVPYEQTPIGKLLPTTETHKKRFQESTGGYLAPQNDYEKFANDILTDTASLFLPGKALTKIAGPQSLNLARSFVTSLGANLAEEGVEQWTRDKGKAGLAKVGSMFLLSTLLGRPKAREFVTDLYKQADAAVPEGATVSAETLSDSLSRLRTKMTQGTQAPSEKFVVDEIDSVLRHVKDGRIPIDNLRASKRSINEKLSKVLFETPRKSDQARARNLAKTITKQLDNELVRYGRINPQFGKPFEAAEEGFASLAQSNFLSNAIEKNIRYTPLTAHLLDIFGGGIGGTLAAGAVPYQASKLLYQVYKSPTLRRHYMNTLRAAAQQDAPLLNKELKLLDVGLQKEQTKHRFSIQRPT